MTTCADLEIGLHRRDITHYAVDLRFIHPQSDSDIRLVRGSDLRALVVVANPQDVGDHAPGGTQLAPVDVEGEVARVPSSRAKRSTDATTKRLVC